ncbi:PDZ domain-containing protein [Fimbriiglobus ruber]|uniref:PDZ domain-containing protein n=1 Tax=Fimbriiglobus ruber TaxID=1908690 RepID=UPI003B848E0A
MARRDRVQRPRALPDHLRFLRGQAGLGAPRLRSPAVKAGSKNNSQGGLDLLGPIIKVVTGLLGIKANFETTPRGFVGIETDEQKDGLVVKAVFAGSPADKAGVKRGDRIEAVGVGAEGAKPEDVKFHDVTRARDLTKELTDAKSGDAARLKVRRGDATETLIVVLGKGL